jgi:subtilisin family serine protease
MQLHSALFAWLLMDRVRDAIQWNGVGLDGRGVRVAVIDTGIDLEHPDLRGKVDVESSESCCLAGSIADVHGHGTHIAGIIAGSGEASGGKYRGIAPGVELIVLKVGSEMSAISNDVAQAVLRAVEMGADIINYSGGERGYAAGPPPWKWPTRLNKRDSAFRYAAEKGVLCVAAAGNDGPSPGTVVRPGNLSEVLSVGAQAPPDYRVAPASARGPLYLDDSMRGGVARADPDRDHRSDSLKPDVVVPGGESSDPLEEALHLIGIGRGGVVAPRSRTGVLLGIDPGDPGCSYARVVGTSQATAVVTGLAALLLELGRRSGFDWGSNVGGALRAILRASALRLAVDGPDDWGYGALLWPNVVATLDDCANSPVRRANVLSGPQLHLET